LLRMTCLERPMKWYQTGRCRKDQILPSLMKWNVWVSFLLAAMRGFLLLLCIQGAAAYFQHCIERDITTNLNNFSPKVNCNVKITTCVMTSYRNEWILKVILMWIRIRTIQ
jgi:hypothetical protein